MSTHVRCKVVIDVAVGVWNSSETFEQLSKIAKREAEQAVRGMLQKDGSGHELVGAISVQCVIMDNAL